MRRIIFLVFLGVIYLSGKTQESKLTLIPVYEKTFEDTIVDVIFDTVTVTLNEAKAMGWKEEAFSEEEKAEGKVTIPYPCVLITKEEIRFLDERGKEKKSINRIVKGVKWEGKQGVKIGEGVIKVRKSKGGEYLGVVIPREGSALDGTMKGDLVMYSKGGREMWWLEEVYLSDGDIVPSPNGEYAIGLPPAEYPAGAPYIYTREGMEELKVKEWDNGWKNGYAVSGFDFSDDGVWVGFVVYNFPVGDTNIVIMFNYKRKNISITRIYSKINQVVLTPSGYKFIIFSVPFEYYTTGDTTLKANVQLWDKKGNKFWTLRIPIEPGWYATAFSYDEKKLVVGIGKSCYFLDILNGGIFWENKKVLDECSGEATIKGIDTSMNLDIICLWGSSYIGEISFKKQGQDCILILNGDGKILKTVLVPFNYSGRGPFTTQIKRVIVSNDGKYFQILSNNSIKIFLVGG